MEENKGIQNSGISNQRYKRNISYKMRIGSILSGNPVIEEGKFRHLEKEGMQIVRINLIANVIDKFIQEGEKNYGSITLDDATGQIRVKVFGEDLDKITEMNQGDTVLVIGMIRSWNNELYIIPEIIKKKDPSFLLVRKLEKEAEEPKRVDSEKTSELKEKIVQLVKEAEKEGGIFIDQIIMKLQEPPELINSEIKKILENGTAYEPRPGKLRYLG